MRTKRTSTSSAIALAACRVELGRTAPTELRLIPAGHFKARDGRPYQFAQGWHLDAAGAARLIAQAALRADSGVIDYEHQTLNVEKNGQPAPAAGWFDMTKLEWRADGLYATGVEWTAAARGAIEAGEYRYLSPVMKYHPDTGEVLSIEMAALTNYPAIDGLDGLAVRAAARFNLTSPTNPEDSIVDREKLISLLGLKTDASDADIEAAIAALKAGDVEALKTQVATLQTAAAETEALKTQLAALKAAGASSDPAHFVPLTQFEALKTELAALKTDTSAREVERLVTAGLADGKLLAAQESWARELGTKDLAALKGYLDKTPGIAALKGQQTTGKQLDKDGKVTLSDAQLAICKATGINPDDYRKSIQQEN